MSVTIRKNVGAYMQELRQWLSETKDTPPEEMSDFFSRRLDVYEEHMSAWKTAYRRFAELLPADCREILDLGCGTGLELDEIFSLRPELGVTGVDLCRDMLGKLTEKHPDKNLRLVCKDYFEYDMSEEKWDSVISFESLHHFFPAEKLFLYRKIYAALKKSRVFLSGDYVACCDEEEELLKNACLEKRKRFGVPDGRSVHLDIPLTIAQELELLYSAGFSEVSVVDSIDGATLICAKK